MKTIHAAAKEGDLDAIKVLLKNDPGLISSKDFDGATPLIVAVENGHLEVTRLLLASRADVSATNGGGQTPLHVAAIVGQKDAAKLLLDNEAPVDARDGRSQTPLHFAAMHGREDFWITGRMQTLKAAQATTHLCTLRRIKASAA
jgi:ankyrin repeat protein